MNAHLQCVRAYQSTIEFEDRQRRWLDWFRYGSGLHSSGRERLRWLFTVQFQKERFPYFALGLSSFRGLRLVFCFWPSSKTSSILPVFEELKAIRVRQASRMLEVFSGRKLKSIKPKTETPKVLPCHEYKIFSPLFWISSSLPELWSEATKRKPIRVLMWVVFAGPQGRWVVLVLQVNQGGPFIRWFVTYIRMTSIPFETETCAGYF